eukprot:jgi/Botrbrau1/19971/Bobra.0059s0086.1
MSEPDLLFTVRNNFYLGAFQTAIADASELEGLSDSEKIERDCFVYRSYIELGSYELVINEVTKMSPQALTAVKLLAQYRGNKLDKEAVLETVGEWVADPACSGNATTLLVCGLIYAAQENYVEALKACHTGLNLEMMALSVQVYLKIDRVDQAEKQLKAMSALDDDATLTQLATAWVGLHLGGQKVQEAYFIYHELAEKYNWTVRLYNGAAAANMQMGSWEEAERELQDALEKDPKNPETLANLITASLHLNKPTARYSNQLKALAPNHPASKRAGDFDTAFDRAALEFAPAA